MNISVRNATEEDFPRITGWMNHELGYHLDPAAHHAHLRRLLAHPDHTILIAEADGEPAGFLGFFCCLEYELTVPYLRLAALAVSEVHQHQGIGSALLKAAEDHAAAHGIRHLELESHLDRKKAHDFYHSNGYTEFSLAFQKDI